MSRRGEAARVGAAVVAVASGLWVSLASPPCRGDERREIAFDYGLALELLQVRDDLLRPLRWTGGTLGIALGLDAIRPDGRHRADLGLAFGVLWNRFGHQGAVVQQDLHYAYVHRVARGRPFDVLVGGAYRYQSIDAVYVDWDDSFMYWFTMHTLAPAVAFETSLSATSELVATVEIPMVGFVSRPPEERIYKVDPLSQPLRWPKLTHAEPMLTGPTNLFAPTLSASYVHRYGEHFGLRVAAEIFYRDTLEPKIFRALGERVAVELRHAF